MEKKIEKIALDMVELSKECLTEGDITIKKIENSITLLSEAKKLLLAFGYRAADCPFK